jgi:hypothetical protein
MRTVKGRAPSPSMRERKPLLVKSQAPVNGGLGKIQPLMHTLTLLIPLAYNPELYGARRRIEVWKLEKTENEIREYFYGYSVSVIGGWYRNAQTDEEFRDHHLRFEIDVLVTPSIELFLRRWKKLLQDRLIQQSIYMKLSGPISWV